MFLLRSQIEPMTELFGGSLGPEYKFVIFNDLSSLNYFFLKIAAMQHDFLIRR
jgi:hypothetical protein